MLSDLFYAKTNRWFFPRGEPAPFMILLNIGTLRPLIRLTMSPLDIGATSDVGPSSLGHWCNLRLSGPCLA